MAPGVERVLRVLVALALLTDAVVHLRLAPQMQLAAPGGIGGAWMFRLQAIAALVAAGYLLWRGSRLAYLIAAVVLVSVFAAVLVYSFVDVPAIGPVPAMYDPFWYPEKTLSTVVEGLGAVLAVLGWWGSGRSVAAEPPVRAGRRE
ncbi:hypothetical protein [Ornithinimicrobium cavernae]|uniref:hypothetical protein n=1 Tax=Ornithinimicrobium cavernae TaxID=2666047 RepID=UPI000D689D9D|nr:hypothetical protein [Ornithinimicrobium cavernae]